MAMNTRNWRKRREISNDLRILKFEHFNAEWKADILFFEGL